MDPFVMAGAVLRLVEDCISAYNYMKTMEVAYQESAKVLTTRVKSLLQESGYYGDILQTISFPCRFRIEGLPELEDFETISETVPLHCSLWRLEKAKDLLRCLTFSKDPHSYRRAACVAYALNQHVRQKHHTTHENGTIYRIPVMVISRQPRCRLESKTLELGYPAKAALGSSRKAAMASRIDDDDKGWSIGWDKSQRDREKDECPRERATRDQHWHGNKDQAIVSDFDPESYGSLSDDTSSSTRQTKFWMLLLAILLAFSSAIAITNWNSTCNPETYQWLDHDLITHLCIPNYLTNLIPRSINQPSHAEFAVASTVYFFSTTWYSHRLSNERYREPILALVLLLGVSLGLIIGRDLQSILLEVVVWCILAALLASTLVHHTVARLGRG